MKRKPRVYLNSIRVESEAEPELLEAFYSEDCAALRSRILDRLETLVALPHVSTITATRPGDLALDLLVPRFEVGIWVFDMRYRLFRYSPGWRPWLELRARLCRVISGETIREISVTAKMSPEIHAARTRSLRALLGIQPPYQPRDLDALVTDCCLQALDRLRASVKPAT